MCSNPLLSIREYRVFPDIFFPLFVCVQGEVKIAFIIAQKEIM